MDQLSRFLTAAALCLALTLGTVTAPALADGDDAVRGALAHHGTSHGGGEEADGGGATHRARPVLAGFTGAGNVSPEYSWPRLMREMGVQLEERRLALKTDDWAVFETKTGTLALKKGTFGATRYQVLQSRRLGSLASPTYEWLLEDHGRRRYDLRIDNGTSLTFRSHR